ncbi:MAG: hypothetical protein K0M48_05820 [Thiobacillus sp.]|nr:hypothetical protein [Thiobacillus sp.]
MSDLTPESQDTPPEASQNDVVDQSRRKLTGAALGVSAVFTLASRPVWASQCTISGMASGNLSTPGGTPCEGCTPGYWKQPQHFFAWSGYRAVDVSPMQKADTFNAVFNVEAYKKADGTAYTLLEVMRDLNGNRDPISPSLGFHAVAALLNAAHSSINFGYTSGEIIVLFQTNFQSNPGALKDALDMLNNRGCPLGSDPDNRNIS